MSFTHFRFRCMRRKVLIIFVTAFILNLIWEQAHSALYISYQGGAITHLILLRAALFDAAVITLFACPFLLLKSDFNCLRSPTSTALFIGLLTLFAILLEKWALATGRWVYADIMPLIPLLHIGLTPAIQLGTIGYLSLKISNWFSRKA